MSALDQFSQEDLDNLKKLLEIEKIRKKKTVYSHMIDGLNIEAYANLYTDDAICEWGPFGNVTGSAGVYELNSRNLADRLPYFSFHVSTNLWIELTSDTTASSRSYLLDINNDTNPRIFPVRFFGVYEEQWRKDNDDWKICRQWAQFIWPERLAGPGFPHPMPEPTSIG